MTYAERSFMGEKSQGWRLDCCFGEACARVLRRRYAVHTEKRIAQDLRITTKAAENLLLGHLSKRSMSLLVQAYGLQFLIDTGAEMTGQSLETFIETQAADAERAAARAKARAHELRTLRARLASPDRSGDGVDRRAT
jgi:hypothetical protein